MRAPEVEMFVAWMGGGGSVDLLQLPNQMAECLQAMRAEYDSARFAQK